MLSVFWVGGVQVKKTLAFPVGSGVLVFVELLDDDELGTVDELLDEPKLVDDEPPPHDARMSAAKTIKRNLCVYSNILNYSNYCVSNGSIFIMGKIYVGLDNDYISFYLLFLCFRK